MISKQLFIIILTISLTVISVAVAADPQCIDNNGSPVDWWVIYKRPALKDQPRITPYYKGFGYTYADANSQTLNEVTNSYVNESKALTLTLAPLYQSKSQYLWLEYNDQPPNISVSTTYAHAKGALSFGNTTGFWLIHSVPNFPPDPKIADYSYPWSGTVNGQTFFCVTYKSTQFESIINQLYINRVYVYSSQVPKSTTLSTTQLSDMLGGGYQADATGHQTELTSNGGVAIKSYAKNTKWNNDLYQYLVQPSLGQAMVVQSWRNGANDTLMPSFCKSTLGGNYTYDSMNIIDQQVNLTGGVLLDWDYTIDHKKKKEEKVETFRIYADVGIRNELLDVIKSIKKQQQQQQQGNKDNPEECKVHELF
ncbi:hypothetical protein SAMD00019534_077360 [Acytostelium subglobosum LB1]|uniref:hypothetical protein n=1 Tax=Acytostelium subglobosum LB1 TaxID=1410327 RepID=UPI000644DAD2|nr:hypothetical protein SAMD00019534_077360 [Acytostelium subglobosum LB1]GAM24561.1 hypothetical protein SAMD00019534_077360 [Acytostelium subglobosum LB1]|eukprot:XP_012752230.1 hypothetical protein SAMD00019534_077360 [Acytostelium subglobosum LB1]